MTNPIKPIRRVVTGNDAQGRSRVLFDRGQRVMKPGDVVVQLGNWHGWSNRSGKPCTIAFSSHDAKD